MQEMETLDYTDLDDCEDEVKKIVRAFCLKRSEVEVVYHKEKVCGKIVFCAVVTERG